jgi:hypothetical protein
MCKQVQERGRYRQREEAERTNLHADTSGCKQERETETEMYCCTFPFATESPFEGIAILLHKSFFAHLF